MEERIQKLIASSGVCSRRAAEKLLTDGRVLVNGALASLGEKADPGRDEILIDGKPLPKTERLVYVLVNKPRGYVTTLSDEQGRKTVAELVADVGVRVFPVGRLDLQSEGLLLMTNDGALMQRLIHPKYEIAKEYRLTVAGNVRDAARRLSEVTDLDGARIRPAEVRTLREQGQSAELSVVIHEGKNRQIRRMCEQCGLIVKRLRRVREDTLRLGDLAPGGWRYLTEEELRALKDK